MTWPNSIQFIKGMIVGVLINLHCVSKKVHPCDFHDNNVKWKPT